jgi:hypothetical protein
LKEMNGTEYPRFSRNRSIIEIHRKGKWHAAYPTGCKCRMDSWNSIDHSWIHSKDACDKKLEMSELISITLINNLTRHCTWKMLLQGKWDNVEKMFLQANLQNNSGFSTAFYILKISLHK